MPTVLPVFFLFKSPQYGDYHSPSSYSCYAFLSLPIPFLESTPQPASPIKSLEDDSKNIETFEANGYTLPIGSLEEISASTQAQDFSQAPKAPQPTIDPSLLYYYPLLSQSHARLIV